MRQQSLMGAIGPVQLAIPDPSHAAEPIGRYWCRKCQCYHRENEAIYRDHYNHRDKRQGVSAMPMLDMRGAGE